MPAPKLDKIDPILEKGMKWFDLTKAKSVLSRRWWAFIVLEVVFIACGWTAMETDREYTVRTCAVAAVVTYLGWLFAQTYHQTKVLDRQQ